MNNDGNTTPCFLSDPFMHRPHCVDFSVSYTPIHCTSPRLQSAALQSECARRVEAAEAVLMEQFAERLEATAVAHEKEVWRTIIMFFAFTYGAEHARIAREHKCNGFKYKTHDSNFPFTCVLSHSFMLFKVTEQLELQARLTCIHNCIF